MSKNTYLTDFYTQLRDRYADDNTSMSYSDWIMKNTTLRKRPFKFDGYEFQQQIVDDMSKNMSVIKCSQIGLTEVQMRKFAAFLMRERGTKAIFTLPTDDMFRRVSQTRFSPMIAADKVFNVGSVEKPVRRVDLYQFDQSFGFFVGNSEGAATSIDADFLAHDELDLSDQEMIALFQSRLQGSDYRITQSFSTPTFEGFGIDGQFQASDQHEYMTKCPHCRHYNLIDWTPEFINFSGLTDDINDFDDIDDDLAAKIDFSKSYVMCERCHKPLELGDPSLREWVPRHPGRRSRGYRVSPFATPRLTIDYILDSQLNYYRKNAHRRFKNTTLGKADNDNKARLSEEELRAAMISPANPTISDYTPVVIGIDVGAVCHIVLYTLSGPKPTYFGWKQVTSGNLADEVRQLRETYNIVGGAIDRNPETTLSNQIRDESYGKILPTEYGGPKTMMSVVNDELGNVSHVRGPRTELIDTVVDDVRKRNANLAGYGTSDHIIVEHFRDMVRMEKPDESAVWNKLKGNDHWMHAAVYARFAARIHNLVMSTETQNSLLLTSTVALRHQNEPNLGVIKRGISPYS